MRKLKCTDIQLAAQIRRATRREQLSPKEKKLLKIVNRMRTGIWRERFAPFKNLGHQIPLGVNYNAVKASVGRFSKNVGISRSQDNSSTRDVPNNHSAARSVTR